MGLAAAIALAVPAGAGAAAQLDWAAATPIGAAGGSSIVGISCTGSSFCVAADGNGSVIAGDPHSTSWSAKASGGFDAVSCASASLCVAVGSGGAEDLATSTDPAGGWSVSGKIDAEPLTGVSCPTNSFCAAVDQAGDLFTSSNPANAGSWTARGAIDGSPLRAISCASESLCVALDEAGQAIASTTPSSAGSWRPSLSSASALASISCAAGQCLAGSQSGQAVASVDPASAAPTWSSTPLGNATLTGTACVSSGLCVAVEGGRQVFWSDNAAGLLPGWSGSSIAGASQLAAVSCVAEGFCAAAGAKGEVAAGQLPAPSVATGSPSGVTQTGATVSGTVDPQDAPLSSCRFEYGTTTSYGQSAPCASTPGPGSAPVTVSAGLGGLTPATTYHYRLVAATATGQGVGADGTLTTAAPASVSLVHPAPYITGVPANGDRLQCNPGVKSSATYTYAWWRDESPIAGATKQLYQIVPEDAGQHLQCEVIATDAAGSASARSAFVTVPAQGLPISAGETAIGTAKISGGKLLLPVSCSPQADPECKLALHLTAVETLRGAKVLAVTARAPGKRPARERSQTVTLLSRKFSVPTGKQQTVSLPLNSTGKRLVTKAKRLSAQLTVEGTVIGILNATLAKEQVSFAPADVHAAAAHAHAHKRVKRAHGARRRR